MQVQIELFLFDSCNFFLPELLKASVNLLDKDGQSGCCFVHNYIGNDWLFPLFSMMEAGWLLYALCSASLCTPPFKVVYCYGTLNLILSLYLLIWLHCLSQLLIWYITCVGMPIIAWCIIFSRVMEDNLLVLCWEHLHSYHSGMLVYRCCVSVQAHMHACR